MATMNKVFLAGNLTRDPELKYVPSGKAVADFRLAVTRKFRGADGDTRQDTCYVDMMVWERQAENCGKYLKKGAPVFVEGSLRYEEWKKDGQTHSRLSVTADRVHFLDRPQKRDEFADTSPGATQSEPKLKAPPRRGLGAQQPRPAAVNEGVPEAGAAESGAGDSDDLPF